MFLSLPSIFLSLPSIPPLYLNLSFPPLPSLFTEKKFPALDPNLATSHLYRKYKFQEK
jgi:hypothetical protein